MKKLRKFLNASVMVMTILAMSGLGMFTPNFANAAASAGDLIKMEGNTSVYYFDGAKRFVFPNEATYFSWYSDCSGVVTIPASELQSYLLGGNVTMRPGTKLVKITTDPKVYAVEANGTLRHVQTEAQAIALYGTDWAKRVVDVPDAFFTNYTIGTALTSGSIPAGSLVKNAGSASVYYYDGTNYRTIASEAAMTANRFSFDNVLTITNPITAGGTAITAMETALVKTSQGGATGPIVTGSGLMVSLNSSTPAAMNIPGNSSVEFLKINLTAANDGPINVSSITLTAYGLSDATNIDDVTIYDNGVKVGTSKNINSDRIATFNFATPIAVAAGATKTLTVKATVAATSGTYGLGIASAASVTSSAVEVSGSFPVQGNLMSAVSASLGTLTVSGATALTQDVNFGEDNVLLADFTLRAGSNENALLQSIALYNSGTNANDIVGNLKLFIDGEEMATGVYADRYVTFVLNNYEIEKNDTISLEVKGDIGITSQNDTIKMYIKETNDIVAIGKTHGFGLAITNTTLNSAISTITLKTGDFAIDMDKAATPAKDIKADTKDVVLATVKMTSNGENATLSGIANTGFYVTTIATTSLLLENVKLVDKTTGGIYDLTVATSSTATRQVLTLDDEISFVKGVTKTFEIRADVLNIVAENTTFVVTLAGSAMAIEGDVSGANITNITPSSVSGSIVTVKDASLTLTPTVLVSTSVVGGTDDVIVYQGKVKAGTADGVKLQSVKLTSATSTLDYSAFTDSNITKLSLWMNGKLLKEVSNQIANDSTTSNGTITFSSLDNANYTVPAGAEYDLVVKATFASSLTEGDFKLAADAASWTVKSVIGTKTVTVPAATTASRIVTVAEKGTLNVALVITSANASRDSFLLAGSETEAGRYLGELKFTTAKEAVKVETLTLATTTNHTATNADLASVKLVDASGNVIAVGSVDADGDVTFDPFNIVFDADKSTSLFIVAVAKGINTGSADATASSGVLARYKLGAVTAKGNASGETITAGTTGTVDSKTATIVGSKLNSVVSAMADGTLTGGSGKTLGKYTLVFDNGSNRATSTNEAMKAVLESIKITFSSTATVTNPYLYIEGYSANTAASTTSLAGDGSITWTNLSSLVDGGKVDGTITLVVAGQVTTAGENQYIQTSIADLNGADGDDIRYDANGDDHEGSVINMFIPTTYVNGGTLSN